MNLHTGMFLEESVGRLLNIGGLQKRRVAEMKPSRNGFESKGKLWL